MSAENSVEEEQKRREARHCKVAARKAVDDSEERVEKAG